MSQLISREDFTSVQEVQAGITRLLKSASAKNKFYRVMRNKEPLGVLIPENLWMTLVEDLEALSSPGYLKIIKKSRSSKKRISSRRAKKILKIE